MSENMADKMKRKLSTKSVTAIILFGAIILVFVFFGLPGKLGGGFGSVARVNNALISVADFQQQENRILEYYQNLFGGKTDFSSQRQFLRQQALEDLVTMELISQASSKNGIVATDAEIVDYIVHNIPFLQQNGQFQREFYTNYLQNTHATPASFEAKIRKMVVNVRSRHLFESVSKMNAAEIQKQQALSSQKINVRFARLDTEELSKTLSKEKVDAAVKALDEALAKGDEAVVNSQLNAMKVNWDETGLVEYSADSFPKITSSVATEAVFELKKDEPLLKRLVRDGNVKFVLKLKEAKVEAPKALEAKVAEMSEKRRGDGLFEAWIRQFRAQSDVSKNDAFLKMN